MKVLIFLVSMSQAFAGTDFDRYRWLRARAEDKQLHCRIAMSNRILEAKLCEKDEDCLVKAYTVCELMFPKPPIPPECKDIR